VLPFAGTHANMPWWLNTWIVLVEGVSGVFAYGDLKPGVDVGDDLVPGSFIGQVLQVLRFGKERPTSMLHLEMHAVGSRDCPQWLDIDSRPPTLLDPTPILLTIAGSRGGAGDVALVGLSHEPNRKTGCILSPLGSSAITMSGRI
jgi:hypothetical protein